MTTTGTGEAWTTIAGADAGMTSRCGSGGATTSGDAPGLSAPTQSRPDAAKDAIAPTMTASRTPRTQNILADP